jgi:hypothetical protein
MLRDQRIDLFLQKNKVLLDFLQLGRDSSRLIFGRHLHAVFGFFVLFFLFSLPVNGRVDGIKKLR